MVEILETHYNGQPLRYFVFDKNKIVFNTSDLYKILDIKEPVEQPEEDLAGAIRLASSDVDFAEWLMDRFQEYSDVALLRPSDLVWD